jgi:phenylalanyl-tRNA synthetase beta chain
MLAAVLMGEAEPAGWWGPSRAHDWSDALAVAEVVADSLGLELERRRGADPSFHPGRCVDLLLGSAVVGVAGELHPSVLEALGLPARTCAVELDLDACMGAALAVRPAPEVSTHPVAKEDLALVVPDDVPAAAVEQALREGAGGLLESIRLFDVYRGPQVPSGHRSLAFALRLRAQDRTLDAAETAAARAGAIAAAAERCGAVLR